MDVGIYLGTTKSCIYYTKGGYPKLVYMPDGSSCLPSVVFYGDSNPILGNIVRAFITQGRPNLARYSRRLLGKDFNSPEVEELRNQAHCPLVEVNGKPVYAFKNGTTKTPEDVCADIVKYLLNTAKKFTEKTIGNVCVAVPSQFDDSQRRAMIEAVKKAGIPEDHISLISEPIAAAIHYLRANPMENGHLLVFDFGQTLEVSIVRVKDEEITVEANRGDDHLGGLDMDYAILEWMKTEYRTVMGEDLPERDKQGTNRPLLKLLAIAEKAKRDLSASPATDIVFEGIQGVDPEFTIQMTRSRLEIIIKPFIDRAMDVIKDALEACGLEKGDINDVILYGGSTCIPIMRDTILNYFNLPPKDNADVYSIVAEGACSMFAI